MFWRENIIGLFCGGKTFPVYPGSLAATKLTTGHESEELNEALSLTS